MEKLKITMINGMILTVDVSEKTATHILGTDKFGRPVKLPITKIDIMVPFSGTSYG